MVVTTVFWGGSFVFNKIGFREIPPVTFLFFRFSLATLLMGLLSVRRARGFNRGILRKGVAVGLALGATNITFVLGVSGTSVSRAGFLNNLFVLIIPVLCFLIWRDRVSRATSAGILLAVAGLWSLARGGATGFTAGDLLSTICAVFIAIHIIAVSKILKDEDVYLVTLVQFAVVALMGGLLSWFFSPPFRPFGLVSASAILYCAVFPTVISFTLQNTWQRFTTPAQAGLIYTLDPIWSMIGGLLFLGERLTAAEWAGCALIFIGVAAPLMIRRIGERRRVLPDMD
ncbi:MAG TPA: DMT family transporter [Geobacteraceae bacterium]|nr:DMT family transporter [Geobacteraceae bacterium]